MRYLFDLMYLGLQILTFILFVEGVPENVCTKTRDSSITSNRRKEFENIKKNYRRRLTDTSFRDLHNDKIYGNIMDTVCNIRGPPSLLSGSWGSFPCDKLAGA